MQGNINIPDSNITTNLTFRQLVLMNMQQLTNFPYIEKDFDALTDYELLCLVVKFLNDVIANQNEQNDSITRMYNSFLALQDYVNNTKDEVEDAFNELDNYVRDYFDNLDVQDEINVKLEIMAQDGTLEEIINQEIFSGMNEQISANTSNISTLQTRVTTLENEPLSSYRTIFVGDSYLAFNNSYGDRYKTLTGLADGDYYKFASNGAGFIATGSGGKNFYQVLNENLANVTNKNTIRKIIVGCCYNDAAYASGYDSIIAGMTSFRNLCKTNFPNAKIYVIGCGYNVAQTAAAGTARFNMQKIVMSAISNQTNQDMIFVDGSNMWLRDSNWFNEDLIHPNATGQEVIAKRLVKYMLGQTYVEHINANISLTIWGNSATMNGNIYGDKAYFEIGDINMSTGLPESYNTDGFNEIGTWTSDLVHPSSNTSLRINGIKVVFLDTTEGWHFCENATLCLNPDGKLYLVSRIAKSSGGMYTFTSLTRIIIYATYNNVNMNIN